MSKVQAEFFQFPKEADVVAINFVQLKKSAELGAKLGAMPATLPVEHYKLIEQIVKQCEEQGFVAKLNPIRIYKRGASIIMSRNEEFCNNRIPIARWNFGKLFVKLCIYNPSEKVTKKSILVTYTDQGIRIAFVENDNDSNWFSKIKRENILSTYGETAMDWVEILQMVKIWLMQLNKLEVSCH